MFRKDVGPLDRAIRLAGGWSLPSGCSYWGQEVFGRMPEEFPPKRMMHSLEEIREQNRRILRHFEENRMTLASVSEGR